MELKALNLTRKNHQLTLFFLDPMPYEGRDADPIYQLNDTRILGISKSLEKGFLYSYIQQQFLRLMKMTRHVLIAQTVCHTKSIELHSSKNI